MIIHSPFYVGGIINIVTFKERVKNTAILHAPIYERNYIQYEYLICSDAFKTGFHIVKSDRGNYLHLIGIHTELSAEAFFKKCISGELDEEDFDFNKPGQSEKSVKGSVRKKITVLPAMMNLFTQTLIAENNFKKNKVECAFATTDNTCTLGFAVSGRPKSLLKGNELNKEKAKNVDLIFRKPRSSKTLYQELIWGNRENIKKYQHNIQTLITPEFFIS